jgi:hypothetical protein
MRSDRSPEPTCALRSAARLPPQRAAFEIVEPRAQDGHGDLPVAVLGFLGTRHHDPAGQMGDAHGRVGRVHMLPARAAGAHRVDADVLGGDVDIDGLGLRQDGHGGRRGVDAPARFGFRDTLHPVHAAFVFQPREDTLAHDPRGDLLDAAKLGLLQVDDLDGQPLASA